MLIEKLIVSYNIHTLKMGCYALHLFIVVTNNQLDIRFGLNMSTFRAYIRLHENTIMEVFMIAYDHSRSAIKMDYECNSRGFSSQKCSIQLSTENQQVVLSSQ